MTAKPTRWGKIFLGLLGAVISQAPAHAQHPNVARGWTPSGVLDVGGIDTVNPFNGNLSIRIPIGSGYPAGGPMGSYSFTLTYNSNVWNHLSRSGFNGGGQPTTSVYAVPDALANAGLGWSFSLGQIGGPSHGTYNGWLLDPPPSQGRTIFHAADGAEHSLFDDGTHWISADGTHLRYEPNSRVLELPDGTRESFDAGGYPTSILDRFGNGLNVTYHHDFAPPNQDIPSSWTISDGIRQHTVSFRPTGYAWPLQRVLVDSIQVAKFGGGFATYKFLYNGEDESGNGFQNVTMRGFGTVQNIAIDPPWRPAVFVLTRVILPDGRSYSMPLTNYVDSLCGAAGQCQGPLGRLELPTGGAMEWDYELRSMPVPNTSALFAWTAPTWSFSLHAAKRRLYDEHGFVGEWKYGGADADLPINHRPDEVTRQVTYPPAEPGGVAQRVVTYYTTCVYGVCSDAGYPDNYASEYGLPFSRRQTPDGSGRFLSQEIYPTGSTVPVRRIYVNYENDGPPGYAYDTTDGFPQLNQRLQSQRTVFLDDLLPAGRGYAMVTVESSDYDGVGHYRQVTTSDNFGFGTVHTERTKWNPNGPPTAVQPWLLNTFTYQEQEEGSTPNRQEYLFDPANGFLVCRRILENGRSQGAFDVLVAYEHDAKGNITQEKWFGGDKQNVNGYDCGSLPPVPAFAYSHQYAAGTRNKTTVQATTTLSLLDLDIDVSSGLASATRDASGWQTSLLYDSMGRLTSSAPQGDAATTIDYHDPGTPLVVDLAVGPVNAPLAKRKWTFDGLGRVVQEQTGMPAGGFSGTAVIINPLGWKLFESEPAASPVTPGLNTLCAQGNGGTAYCNFDAFGRPGKVMTADGKTTTLTYQGTRIVKRSRRVWDGIKEVLGTTREEYDGLGRLRRIREPNGIWTRYDYDSGGRLTAVTANQGGSNVQSRTFRYDGRGFLWREVQPESGIVSYKYDARGNVTHKITPTGTILYDYDAAGRLTQVSSPQAPLRILSYAPGGSSTGRLEQTRAFNDRLVGGSCRRFEVREDFSYNTTHRRLETELTSLFDGGIALEKWSQGYAYDGAGQVQTFTYPSCLAGCSDPARTQTVTYALGRPTAVPGLANAITYNGTGLLSTIVHANGVTFWQTPDATGMARPGSLSTNRDWHQEAYSYDASGNIKSIGVKTFTYDPSSRLTSATLPVSNLVFSNLPYRGYTYDAFGNLTRVTQGASATNNTSYVEYTADAATNRLQGAAYDGAGNLTSYQGSTYTWDVLGNLTSLNTGGEQWVHLYDASGERTWSWRTAPSRVDNYTLRGLDAKVLSVFTKIGSAYTWEDYLYREGQLLGAKFSDGSVAHFDVDHLGNVRQETDAGGTVIKYREFWPYGEEATTPSGTERMKFAGHERDLGNVGSTADDVDYMHARYYKGLFGRFLTPDSLAGSADSPPSWNRYAYVRGRPLIATDPNGRLLEFSGADRDKAEIMAILNSGMSGQQLQIDSSGNATLVPTTQQGPPSPQQAATAALLGAVIANAATTKISLVRGDSAALMGQIWDHKLDVADVSAFGNGPGPTAAALATHEIVEQFAQQVTFGGKVGTQIQKESHRVGTLAEEAAGGYARGKDSLQPLGSGSSARITTVYTMKVGQPVTAVVLVTTGNVVTVTRP